MENQPSEIKTGKIKSSRIIIAALIFSAFCFGIWFLFFRQEIIHIAMVAPMSGDSAAVGNSFIQGVNLYLDSVNEKGGIDGKKIVLDVYDDQNNADTAREKAEQIVEEKRAMAVIGHHYSSCSISAGKVYKEYGIPAISPASTNVAVTKGNEWYFRSSFNDDIQGRFIASYANKVFEAKTVSIIHEDDAYGDYIAKVFEKTCNELGVEVKYKWPLEIKSEILEQEMNRIVADLQYKEKEAGVIFISTHAEPGGKIVKLIRDAMIRNTIIAPDSFSSESFQQLFLKYLKEKNSPGFYTDGIYTTTPLIFDTTNEKGLKFREAYMEQYGGKEPGWHAAFAYDTAMVIAEALKNTVPKTKAEEKNDTLAVRRKKIRDYLASLNSMNEAIEGVTGYNFFDEEGDSQKPIFMGTYKNQKLISALTQFRAIPNISEVPDFKDAVKKGNALMFDGKYSYKVNVVYTGIEINEISELDVDNFTCMLDFYLWFRYQGDINIEDIEFLNAADPIQLPKPALSKDEGELKYRLYQIKGKFRADFIPNLHIFGQHILGISFRPRALDRNNLILVKDILGMRITSDKSLLEKIQKARVLNEIGTRGSLSLIEAKGDTVLKEVKHRWKINEVWFFQDIVQKPLLGNPAHFNVQGGTLDYSRFNFGIRIIEEEEIMIRRRWPPDSLAGYFTIASAIVTLFLLLAVKGWIGRMKYMDLRKHSKSIFFLQAAFVTILLLSAEVFVLDMSSELTAATFDMIVMVFNIVWWGVRAFFLTVAVERFLWIPSEEKTGQPIPKILRGLVSLIIYILAIMAVVAFVYNQKLTSLLATSGVIAMIVGLAIQINISNIFSGIAINVERPFRVGDWVKIGNFTEGKVTDINWRTTRLKTRDDTILNIPNSQASESPIENFSRPNRWYWKYYTIHVDPSHPPERVKKILLDAAMVTEGVTNASTRFLGLTAGMTGQSESWAANYLISTLVEDYGKKFAHNEAVWLNVWTHLKAAGIKHVMERQEVQMYFQGMKKSKSVKTTKTLALLQDLYVFEPFSSEDKLSLSKKMQSHHFRTGQVVVEQGKAGDSMFVIAEGVVSVTVKIGDKPPQQVATLGTGNFFGELAMLTGQMRGATVTALTKTHLYEITKADIFPLFEKNKNLIGPISDVMAKRETDKNKQTVSREEEKKNVSSMAEKIFGQIEGFFFGPK